MKKQKFAIGDKIWIMKNNEPEEVEVNSIVTVLGEIEIGYQKFKSEKDEVKLIYGYGYKNYAEESVCFATKEKLKNYLFPENIELV